MAPKALLVLFAAQCAYASINGIWDKNEYARLKLDQKNHPYVIPNGVKAIYPEDNDLPIQDRQSPINIKEKRAIPTNLPPLVFLNHKPDQAIVKLTNRKNSVSLALSGVSPQPCLIGGPTKIQYCISEAHFHWGESEDEGSEHLLNGESFPAELHVVYVIPSELVTPKRPQFLVTGYFLEVCNENNPLLKTVIDAVKRVIPYNTTTELDAIPFFTLIDMMKDQPTYYTYPGSLTTPPYSEVTWIVFPQPTTISYYQLQQLREIQGQNGNNVLSNFRETFPLGRRKLLKAKTGNHFKNRY